jgi:hypothetical protein
VARLDDYAQMARAALVLFEATGEARYLDDARRWVADADSLRDAAGGGYYQSPAGGAGTMPRLKIGVDEQMPSGNAMIADVLARLYYLTGEDRYRRRAEETIGLFFGGALEDPLAHGGMLTAADTLLDAIQVVIVGKRGEAATDELVAEVWRTSLPGRALEVIAPGDDLPAGHPARGKGQIDGVPTAYVCVGTFCSLPVTERPLLADALREIRVRRATTNAGTPRG